MVSLEKMADTLAVSLMLLAPWQADTRSMGKNSTTRALAADAEVLVGLIMVSTVCVQHTCDQLLWLR